LPFTVLAFIVLSFTVLVFAMLSFIVVLSIYARRTMRLYLLILRRELQYIEQLFSSKIENRIELDFNTIIEFLVLILLKIV